ncbi:MAG: DUF5706 domain-containing protein [Desulfuromonas sp.]|nr:DUF5706 domain-containing protein [Desulfuromonas sp.]
MHTAAHSDSTTGEQKATEPSTSAATTTGQEEQILPRLMASNALRANLSKHMMLNKMADSKASIILTASSLIITITLTQHEQLDLATILILASSGIMAILCSILAIIPPLHASGATNLFYFRSYAELSEEEFSRQFRATIADKEKLYDAYIHELYFLGRHRLTRKYRLIRDGMWIILAGLIGATLSAIWHQVPLY